MKASKWIEIRVVGELLRKGKEVWGFGTGERYIDKMIIWKGKKYGVYIMWRMKGLRREMCYIRISRKGRELKKAELIALLIELSEPE
jgi:hypothetical protein